MGSTLWVLGLHNTQTICVTIGMSQSINYKKLGTKGVTGAGQLSPILPFINKRPERVKVHKACLP